MAGVELNNNTALTTQSKRRFLNSKVTVAGVELNNNTALTTKRTKILGLETCQISAKHYENEEQITEKMAKLWLEWNSTTTQRTRNKASGDIKDVKTCRIFAINKRKRGSIRGEIAKLWLEWNYDNNTASTKPERKTGRKNTLTVLKCLFEICTTMTC